MKTKIAFTKKSSLTGKMNTMMLPVTMEEIEKYNEGTTVIQKVFPNLTPDERNFILEGCTPEEWDEFFKEI